MCITKLQDVMVCNTITIFIHFFLYILLIYIIFNFFNLELDQLFGAIESSIIQEEIQIMIKLSELITQQWIGDLHELLKLIAELDWYVNI